MALQRRSFLLAAMTVVGFAVGLSAEETTRGIVRSAGSYRLKEKPETLRLHVDLYAKGKGAAEAIRNLKDRQEAARSQLAALGAEEKSIEFGDPRIQKDNPQSQQFEAMIRARLGERGKKADKEKPAASVTIVSRLRAEWKLTADSTESLIGEATTLQEKIVAAELSGYKETQKPASEEEEELMEEMAQMAASEYGNQPKPGQPQFLYVKRLSEDQRQKAIAQAYARAKEQAERLAKAAGANLGELAELSESTSANQYSAMAAYGQDFYAQMYGTGEPVVADDEQPGAEAVSATAGPVQFTVSVTAAFRLQ